MKKQSRILMIAVCAMAFASIGFAQSKMKVYIAPTQDGFSNFVSAALLENKLPVEITADEESANFIIVCSGVKGQNKWYDTVFGVEKDRNQGSMKLIRVKDKAVVWASAAGDKSYWFGEFKSMGQSKVANRLARKLKSKLPEILASDTGESAAGDKSQPSEILAQEKAIVVENIPAKSGAIKPTLNADGYNSTGIELFKQSKYAEAENAFREAIRLDPYNAGYHHNLGTVFNAQGKFDEAEKEMELSTRLDPNNETYKKSLEIVRANKAKR